MSDPDVKLVDSDYEPPYEQISGLPELFARVCMTGRAGTAVVADSGSRVIFFWAPGVGRVWSLVASNMHSHPDAFEYLMSDFRPG